MKKVIKILLSIVAVIVCLGAFMFYMIIKDIPKMKATEINNVAISELADGSYTGTFEFSRWKSVVNVSVKDGKVVSIERLSDPLTPDVSSELFNSIIEKQSVDIDAVSGATATSKAYLKSVENALSSNK